MNSLQKFVFNQNIVWRSFWSLVHNSIVPVLVKIGSYAYVLTLWIVFMLGMNGYGNDTNDNIKTWFVAFVLVQTLYFGWNAFLHSTENEVEFYIRQIAHTGNLQINVFAFPFRLYDWAIKRNQGIAESDGMDVLKGIITTIINFLTYVSTVVGLLMLIWTWVITSTLTSFQCVYLVIYINSIRDGLDDIKSLWTLIEWATISCRIDIEQYRNDIYEYIQSLRDTPSTFRRLIGGFITGIVAGAALMGLLGITTRRRRSSMSDRCARLVLDILQAVIENGRRIVTNRHMNNSSPFHPGNNVNEEPSFIPNSVDETFTSTVRSALSNRTNDFIRNQGTTERLSLPSSIRHEIYVSPEELDEKSQASVSITDENEVPICSICICSLGDGEMIATTPCNHIFHSECLKDLYNVQPDFFWESRPAFKCPNCRGSLDPVPSSASTDGSNSSNINGARPFTRYVPSQRRSSNSSSYTSSSSRSFSFSSSGSTSNSSSDSSSSSTSSTSSSDSERCFSADSDSSKSSSPTRNNSKRSKKSRGKIKSKPKSKTKSETKSIPSWTSMDNGEAKVQENETIKRSDKSDQSVKPKESKESDKSHESDWSALPLLEIADKKEQKCEQENNVADQIFVPISTNIPNPENDLIDDLHSDVGGNSTIEESRQVKSGTIKDMVADIQFTNTQSSNDSDMSELDIEAEVDLSHDHSDHEHSQSSPESCPNSSSESSISESEL
ncbi:MAG: hypothetical protein Sylvanvirus15_13 [Sylvanvirus sp.]|uniref:RING-type domain-containing protein n=1 Tax=Sylvanvirus sp. TaxID=2487774 RepID=A0A3G5AJY6_9VIRU|nr:MAG: hypothetical protein Sylvanvirus15_13 [Sylvanvirus sp.]